MEPVKGGNLSNVDMHPEVKAMMQQADPAQSSAAWALRYVASLDGVLTVLSGMSTIEQMKENYKILMEDFKPLTESEKKMLASAAKVIESKSPVGCTGCRYCTDHGCPAGIDIPEVLSCLNMLSQYQNLRTARLKYYQITGNHGPKNCLHCGRCEGECPQKLSIMSLLQQADKKLYAGPNYDPWANH